MRVEVVAVQSDSCIEVNRVSRRWASSWAQSNSRPRIRRPSQDIPWQFTEALFVGLGRITEVPEAPFQRFFGDRYSSIGPRRQRLT